MSLKRRYVRTRPPMKGVRGPAPGYKQGITPPQKGDGGAERCTCWVILKGEGLRPADRNTADCELVPDPACRVHGKKRHPILDEEDWYP